MKDVDARHKAGHDVERSACHPLLPAQAGIQSNGKWVPAFAGTSGFSVTGYDLQYTAGSPESVGLATTFLNEALIGTLRLMPLGGIGFWNHFS